MEIATRSARRRHLVFQHVCLHRNSLGIARRRIARQYRVLDKQHFSRHRRSDHSRHDVGSPADARCVPTAAVRHLYTHALSPSHRRPAPCSPIRRGASCPEPYVVHRWLLAHGQHRSTHTIRRGCRLCHAPAVQMVDDRHEGHSDRFGRRPPHHPSGATQRGAGTRRRRDRLHLPRRTDYPHRHTAAVPPRLRTDCEGTTCADHSRTLGSCVGQHLQL